MGTIVKSLKGPGKDGVELTGGDGDVRRCYPIVACYAADYPEQCLVTCTRYGTTCLKCTATWDEFGSGIAKERRKQNDSIRTLKHAATLGSASRAQEALKDFGLNFVLEPFWVGLPYCDIHVAITLDILHQLYQGVIEHIKSWLRKLIGDAELDAQFKRLPPMHGLRHFTDGISGLSRVSGNEHREICKQILGCVLNHLNVPHAMLAMLDFLFLAQYKSHSTESLKEMKVALDDFHADKEVFVNLGACLGEHFNIPKIHMLEHYIQCIELFGTTDNYNTESTERLHIDYAKEAYRATNGKDYFEQMTDWLERRKKIAAFDIVLCWQRGEMPAPRKRKCRQCTAGPQPLAKTPNAKNVPFSELSRDYGATQFSSALQTFVTQYKDGPTSTRRRRANSDNPLPVSTVNV
ncbi:hypothetical protein JAAARDRAFT_128116 [Jaapia argillacea MUCL 33604]|uniref:CxC2-like cysteine cluster KDZ transposase-associated domain-containing protein n=1 Tax=Jaapia argillacea MUCL 33604 TaxID=933084 RepID=A0A067Q5U7_9AGAM|nr:hypothetical protein JAAARDRAFT_128116 [Jaapia argillacea MUCL 33604]